MNNVFSHNRAGIVPNTLDSEELAPQKGATFAGNHIFDSGNPATPKGGDLWDLMYGIGVVLPGANDNLVTRNLIENNASIGLAISWLPDENIWAAERNTVTDNVFRTNPLDVLMVEQGGGVALGNCFAGNELATSIPVDVQKVVPCGDTPLPVSEWGQIGAVTPPADDENIPYTDVVTPDDQPTMANPLTVAPADASTLDRVDNFDLDAVNIPTGS